MSALEDNFEDIVGKAMRGLVLTDALVAGRAGVSADAVKRLREGQWDEAVARPVAPVLGLSADALAASGRKAWAPAPVALAGLVQFTTPFEDMLVNSYLAWDAVTGEAVAFDTGADCTDMLALLAEKSLKLALIAISHTHGDHIFDLDRLKEVTGARAIVGEREPLEGATPIQAGAEFAVGALRIAARLTWGHSRGGMTYVVHGLERPLAVVGDALFAGSMGGGMVSYADALATNRAEIFTLPDDTVVCPGHGPLTTVGEERVHNPFFAP